MYTNQPAPKFLTGERKLILLPMGSCEQHGPHLPIDTDLRIIQLIAEKLIRSFSDEEALLLPAIPFSCSWEHKGLGTLSLNTGTISAILHDIASSLKTWEAPVILAILNWHGGNSILASLTTEITAKEQIPSMVIQAATLAQKVWNENSEPLPHDVHAGAIETSIIQAFWPELVATLDLAKLGFTPAIKPELIQPAFQALGIHALSPNGVWGYPEQANPQKGRFIIEAIVKEIHCQLSTLVELVNTHQGQ